MQVCTHSRTLLAYFAAWPSLFHSPLGQQSATTAFSASHQTLINGELLHLLSPTPRQAELQLPPLYSYSPPDPTKQLKKNFL